MTESQGLADSADAAACHQRGLELLQGNQPAPSLVEFERAVGLAPANAEFLKSLGNARRAAGDAEGAAAAYRRALELAPDFTASLYNLGLVLLDLGRPAEAERHFRRLREIDPRDAEVIFQLALIAADRSQFSEAVQLYRSALELAPVNPYLWMGLGLAIQGPPDQMEEAVRCLRECVRLKPDLADAHYQLGLACWKLGAIKEAAGSYRKALALEPGSQEAHNDLGNILLGDGRPGDAVAHFREAIRLSPHFAAAHGSLGNALIRMGRLDEAIGCFLKATELQTDSAGVHLALGSAYSLRGAHDQAIRCFEAVLRLRPDDAAAAQLLLFEMQQVCDWSRFEELCEQQRRSADDPMGQQISSFSMLSIPLTPAEQLQCTKNFSRRQLRAVLHDRERPRFRFERKSKPRLRIGYLSADFHEHATAYLMAELFELHDRRRFEIAAYSYGPDDGSPMRSRLKRAFDHFTDIAPLPYTDAAARIHGDQVDILVDLKGYSQFARTEIVALQPAPIQVNYLGYPGTMGVEFIDYLITDRFLTPPDRAEHFSEKLVYMPGSYQVNDRKRLVAATPSRDELGLPERSFVFCCLNQTFKIVPHVFATWMRLLEAVPDSVLWLLESNPWAVQNLHRQAQAHGVDPKRLMFAPMCPYDRHTARMGAADLFLDTSPCNAHTTASDALWVGLPVLTCAGDTFASRVAGSLLTAAGLTELVTTTPQAYEALALRLARRPHELAALREKLSRNRPTAPLFDTPAYTRNLETAYFRMWDNYLSGDGPREIAV